MTSAPRMIRRARSALRSILASQAAGGVVLLIAAAAALVIANSPFAPRYFKALHIETGPVLSPALGPMTVHLWINDGLMALFFLLVGLEIKRELVDGRLVRWSQRRLPFVAAAAGMVAPAIVYLAVVRGDPLLTRGWAIPTATDIAFAVGVLALLGGRAPAALKLLLTSLAIVDDMGAVAIIALVYTETIDWLALAGAVLVAAVLWGMGRARIMPLAPYLIGFAVLWLLTLRSGVHATVAGVVAAMMVPIKPSPGAPDDADSPLHRLEHALQPWVAYAIVPLFGLANAGVALGGIRWQALTAPVVLAVAAGLAIGKPLGIVGGVWLAEKIGIAHRSGRTSWRQIWALGMVGGIGFTMSLFINGLAFGGRGAVEEQVKLGVLAGSLIAGLAGFLVLRLGRLKPDS